MDASEDIEEMEGVDYNWLMITMIATMEWPEVLMALYKVDRNSQWNSATPDLIKIMSSAINLPS